MHSRLLGEESFPQAEYLLIACEELGLTHRHSTPVTGELLRLQSQAFLDSKSLLSLLEEQLV